MKHNAINSKITIREMKASCNTYIFSRYTSLIIESRRTVDITYFLQQIFEVSKHPTIGLHNWDMISEQRNGLKNFAPDCAKTSKLFAPSQSNKKHKPSKKAKKDKENE